MDEIEIVTESNQMRDRVTAQEFNDLVTSCPSESSSAVALVNRQMVRDGHDIMIFPVTRIDQDQMFSALITNSWLRELLRVVSCCPSSSMVAFVERQVVGDGYDGLA